MSHGGGEDAELRNMPRGHPNYTAISSLQFFTRTQENLWDKFISYKATPSIMGWGESIYHLAG